VDGKHEGSAFASIQMRTAAAVTAGTYEFVATEPISVWHRHLDLHEVEYVVSGTAELLTPDSHLIRPAGHAAWIPAGVPHCPVLQDVHTIAVFFDRALFDLQAPEPASFAVPPVLHEMIRYGLRWPITRHEVGGHEPTVFFEAMHAIVQNELAHSTPLLADPTDALVNDVLAYTAANLRDVTTASLCHAVGIGERTLRRRFPAVVGETWQAHLRRLRLGQASALLRDQSRSISDIALETGFDSPSSFTRAFRAWMGETPSDYRDQVLAGLAQKSSS
jgi:AraC-like DNA-binding protein/uncharacterized RmlC-like cupin family protein